MQKTPSRIRLYDLADELYRLAPWEWMSEMQLTGLRHPKTGDLGWMSMMGAAGTHSSLAVYLGEEALHRFNLIHHAAGERIDIIEEDMLGLILESRQVQTSFAVRNELFKTEREEIKLLGRKYRGDNWPCFRSFKPGRAPAVADDEEAVWIECAIEQMLAVAPQLRSDPFANLRPGTDGTHLLTREFADGAWRDAWSPEDSRLFTFPEPEPGELMRAKVARHPSRLDIECQFQLLPNPVGPQGKAIFPYIAMSVDRATGLVLGVEMLSVETQSHADLIASVPDAFLRLWDRNGLRPASLRVASRTTHAMLAKTARSLGIPLRQEPVLPALRDALQAITGFMSR